MDKNFKIFLKRKRVDMVFDNANHPIEHKIKLLLGMVGYDKKEMRFKDSSDGRTLQYGYWKVIDYNDLIYVMNHCDVTFTIHNWEDEDTGPLTAYRMHYTS